MPTVKIGIDFGTSYSFCGFVNGKGVEPLIPQNENYGIPSVFYYDKGQKMTGRIAERNARRKPEFAVFSVKKRLDEKEFILGDFGVTCLCYAFLYKVLLWINLWRAGNEE